MSKKSELEQAEARLAELRAQQIDLQAQISEAERALKNPDFSSVQAAVDQIAMSQTLHQAAAQALTVLLPQITEAERMVEAARRAEREKAAEGLRGKEAEAYQTAINALIALVDGLSALDDVHLQLRSYQVGFRYALPPELARAAAFTYGRLRATDPVRLGLPPLPTPEELRRREAAGNVERARGRVKAIEAQFLELKNRGERRIPLDLDKALNEARDGVKAAEAALAALN